MEAPPQFDRRSDLRDNLDALENLLDAQDSVFLPMHRGHLPLTTRDGERLPVVASASGARPWLDLGGELIFLGLYEDRAHFAIDVSATEDPTTLPGFPATTELGDLRLVASTLPPLWSHLAAYSRGLLHFHEVTQFCGRCGGATRPRKGGHTRLCADCSKEHFPRLEPAVLVLVHHEDRILLARQPGFPSGMYSTLAGFVEPGESLEEATVREVREETGIDIATPRYVCSQPWPFPASLMLGFVAEAVHDRVTLDLTELEDGRFFSREELLAPEKPGFFTPPPFALAGQLIRRFLANER